MGGGRGPQPLGAEQRAGPASRWSFRACGAAHLEDLLHDPAVVLLEGHLVGLGGVDADEAGVVLIAFAVADALEEHLDEAQASAAGRETALQGPVRPRRHHPPAPHAETRMPSVLTSYSEPGHGHPKGSDDSSAVMCLQQLPCNVTPRLTSHVPSTSSIPGLGPVPVGL